MRGENVQKCLTLCEMGNGLLCRIYFMKAKLVSEKRSLYMGPEYLHKFRVLLTKNFPKVPSMKKLEQIPGAEAFASNAGNNCRVLSSFRDLVYDMIDFAVNSYAVLHDMASSSILKTQFERNREVILVYMDLLKIYIRVMTFFSTLKEGKTLFAMYSASVYYLEHSESRGRMSLGGHVQEKKYSENASILFSHMEDTQRHFIDAFNQDLLSTLKPILMNMRISLWAGEDISALVCRNAFDPCMQVGAASTPDVGPEGDNSGQAVIDPDQVDTRVTATALSAESVMDLYDELCHLQSYKESVVFACIACPSLLHDPDILDLLRHVIEHMLVLPVFRDFNLGVHTTLEKLATTFPDATLDPTVIVPRGLKLKTMLKNIAKRAVMTASSYHTKRRVHLISLLSRILSLIEQSPGLVAPKFPLISAVASLAKDEILCYYRHLGGKVPVRRDCKKHYRPEQFASYDIGSLIGNLCLVTEKVRMLEKIIINYYSEYLSGAHLKALVPLLEVTSSQIDMRLHGGVSEYMKSPESQVHMQYLHRGMNHLVDDLVHATTVFSERPDFKTMHKRASVVTAEAEESKKNDRGDKSGSELDGAEGGESTGLDMNTYRLHHVDRRMLADLKRLKDDPFYTPAAHTRKEADSDTTVESLVRALPLVTGDVHKLESFRRNWLAMLDHMNQAMEIMSLDHSHVQAEHQRAKEYRDKGASLKEEDASTAIHSESTVLDRRKETIVCLLSCGELIKLMRVIYRQSRYVDSLPSLLEHHFEPVDAWWFQDSLEDTYHDCLEAESEDGVEAGYAVSILWLNSLAVRSLHHDCPQEADLLAASVLKVTEGMVEDFFGYFCDHFTLLTHRIESMNQQVAPIESAHRLHRILLERKNLENMTGDISAPEPYPGFESHPAEREVIQGLEKARNCVIRLLKSANDFGKNLVIHDRKYHLPAGVVRHLSNITEADLISAFFSGNAEENLNPIVESRRLHLSAVQALKLVCRHIDLGGSGAEGISEDKRVGAGVGPRAGGGEGDSSSSQSAPSAFGLGFWYRSLLYRHATDTSLPSVGQVLPTNYKQNGNTLAWKYAAWFGGLVSQIASGSSGIMYMPQLDAFGTITRFTKKVTSKDGDGSEEDEAVEEEEEKEAIKSYVTQKELQAMCLLIGPSGVRIIDSQLTRICAYLINTDIKGFMEDNEEALTILSGHHAEPGVLDEVVLSIGGTHTFIDSLVTLGFALKLREALYQAQSAVIRTFSPSVSRGLDAVAKSVDPVGGTRGASIAAAGVCKVGSANSRSHSTVAAPAPISQSMQHVNSNEKDATAPTPAPATGGSSSPGAIDLSFITALEHACFDPYPVFEAYAVNQGDATDAAVSSASYVDPWALLPAALASAYLSDLWEHTHYHASHAAFSHNEHTIAHAVNALLLAAFGREGYAQYLLLRKREKQYQLSQQRAAGTHAEARLFSSAGAVASAVAAAGGPSAGSLSSGAPATTGSGARGINGIEGGPGDRMSVRMSSASVKSGPAATTKPAANETVPLSVTSNTDRSLVRDHLAGVAEHYVSMSSSILLFLQSRGKITAQRMVAGALEKLGGVPASGGNSEGLGDNNPGVVASGADPSNNRSEDDGAQIYSFLHTRVNYPDVESGGEENNDDDNGDITPAPVHSAKLTPKPVAPTATATATDTQEDSDITHDFTMRPIAAMATTLEDFVLLCPVISRATLEQYYPYSLLHSSLTDLALGKTTELDERKKFAADPAKTY